MLWKRKLDLSCTRSRKNWVTIGVSTLSMVALAGALLADQSAQADDVTS